MLEAIPTLTTSQLNAERARLPGLIPVRIDPTSREIEWLDFGRFHFYEGFFRLSIRAYLALSKAPPFRCRTPLDILEETPPDDALYPSGFIFNTGRCGSTLLTRVLARSRAHLVLSEAAPHNQIWQTFAPGNPAEQSSPTEQNIAAYRNLLLSTGRKRLASHSAHIVKFTSLNLVHFDAIRRAFPDVPALFLFREPSMVLASYARQPFEWKGWMGGAFGAWEGAAEAVEDLLGRALALTSRDGRFRCLDYSQLQPASLPGILQYFGLPPFNEDLRDMISEFAWDARSEGAPRRFAGPAAAPADSAAATLSDLYTQLLDVSAR